MSEYRKKVWKYRIRVILIGMIAGGIFSLFLTRVFSHEMQWFLLLRNFAFGILMGASVSTSIQLIDSLIIRNLKKLPLLLSLILPPLVMSGIISLLYILFYSLFLGEDGSGEILFLPQTLIFSLAITFIITFSSTISNLLGQKVFLRLLAGTYRKPIQEERFVMFLDMVGSTTIAESLGDSAFLSLLNDFFNDITEPVLQTGAEIYKYVGDEAILTWTKSKGLKNEGVLNLCDLLKEQLEERTAHYMKTYGMVPRFRAGLHFGQVIIGEMGNLKREIALLGDTMNTAARIQGACGEYQKDFLVSETVIKQLDSGRHKDSWHSLGDIPLKGKNQRLAVYVL